MGAICPVRISAQGAGRIVNISIGMRRLQTTYATIYNIDTAQSDRTGFRRISRENGLNLERG